MGFAAQDNTADHAQLFLQDRLSTIVQHESDGWNYDTDSRQVVLQRTPMAQWTLRTCIWAFRLRLEGWGQT